MPGWNVDVGPFGTSRKCEPSSRHYRDCVVFKWIGQSFEHCDECGHPVWEHLYHPPVSGQRVLFRVKERDKYRGWHWEQVGAFVKKQEARS